MRGELCLAKDAGPKECLHKLRLRFVFANPSPSHHNDSVLCHCSTLLGGTVGHKSWGVEAAKAESYDRAARCKLLHVKANL